MATTTPRPEERDGILRVETSTASSLAAGGRRRLWSRAALVVVIVATIAVSIAATYHPSSKQRHGPPDPVQQQSNNDMHNHNDSSVNVVLDSAIIPSDNDTDNNNLESLDSYRRLLIEGTAEPIFLCQQKEQQRQQSTMTCRQTIEAQHDVIWQHVQDVWPTTATATATSTTTAGDEETNTQESSTSTTTLPQQLPLRISSNVKLINLLTVEVPARHLTNHEFQSLIRDQILGHPAVKRVQEQEPESQTEKNNHDSVSSLDNNRKTRITTRERTPDQDRIHDTQQQQDDMNNNHIRFLATNAAASMGRTALLNGDYCNATGQGVRVAILDTGIDYTHERLGGLGTFAAYRAAYGTSPSASENRQRDGLFPTARVVEGRDFVGEGVGNTNSPDNDPIDAVSGHGTMVAAAVLAVAPEALLYAVKVCLGTRCQGQAILDGLEYAMDPNGDDDPSDRVDIVNLSLGQDYLGAYFSRAALAIENAFSLGVLAVVAGGNSGNVPYRLGHISAAFNALSVGATRRPFTPLVAAPFSSRGPGDFDNQIKPELSAPGQSLVLPNAGSGTGLVSASGTSFSCPLVAGAAALVAQRCPSCSPFAIKCILVNTVERGILNDNTAGSGNAPISRTGSGVVNLERALETDVWAFSATDVQPTISLGALNVAEDMTVTRTIRLVNILGQSQEWSVQAIHRDPTKAGALSISFSTNTITLGATCQGETTFDVNFQIVANLVPTNHMTGGGRAAAEFERLDINEFDGWIVLTSTTTNKEISLPFHSILRKAARVNVASQTLPSLRDWPQPQFQLNLENTGVGTAQIDVFQLVYLSNDDPENAIGSGLPNADFRYIGYRTTKRASCGFLLEFAFVTWEKTRTALNTEFQAIFFPDNGNNANGFLANQGPSSNPTGTNFTECRIADSSFIWRCAGFSPEHTTNSHTTIIKACSDDLGLGSTFRVGFGSLTVPFFGTVDASSIYTLSVPTELRTTKFDVAPGATMQQYSLDTNLDPGLPADPLGLLFVTNSFRNPRNTGAATDDTEAIPLVFSGTTIPSEVTSSFIVRPVATDLAGPECDSWQATDTCPANRRLEAPTSLSQDIPQVFDHNMADLSSRLLQESCPERDLFLLSDVTEPPTQQPTISIAPTLSQQPSISPSMTPSLRPSQSPSGLPTVSTPPTAAETASPTQSANPTLSPSSVPSATPTISQAPSFSVRPSTTPSASVEPSSSPSLQPTPPPVLVIPPPVGRPPTRNSSGGRACQWLPLVSVLLSLAVALLC